MTTNRTEDGVRVRVKAGIRAAGRTGTALYGPRERVGETWPGFGHRDDGWTLPVLLDGDDGPCLYSPSELEPGPPRSTHGSRRVRHRDREGTGTLLETLTASGVTWPGLDRAGNLMVPVELDNGQYRIWRATDIERAPEPEPALVPGEPQLGPRVLVQDGKWEAPRPGRVLYRVTVPGRSWPGFDVAGQWRVPVLMDLSGSTLFVPAMNLEPFIEPESVEATILAEADKLANTIQAKALRDVAKAAADALELFTARLRAITREGGGRS